MSELCALSDGRPKDRWGKWVLNTQNLTIVFDPKKVGYDIDLEELDTSAQMLDWYYHAKHKVYFGPQDMYDLMSAFEDIFDPRSTLCGMDKRIDPTKEVREYIRRNRPRSKGRVKGRNLA